MNKPQPVEKPDGARSVSKYDIRIQRAYRPYFAVSNLKEPVFFDTDTCARLSLEIDFFDDAAASEFEAKILSMMPGVE